MLVWIKKEKELKVFAARIRLETARTICKLGFGHLGGALSVVDALAVLYGDVMCFDAENPTWEDRVRHDGKRGNACR